MAVKLVDSSVWIDFLRASGSRADRAMIELVRQPELIATTEPVVMELRSGVAGLALARTERAIAGLLNLGLDPAVDFAMGADIARAVRAGGHTVRSSFDLLIASVALRRGALLVHKDVDFDRISSVVPDLKTESLIE